MGLVNIVLLATLCGSTLGYITECFDSSSDICDVLEVGVGEPRGTPAYASHIERGNYSVPVRLRIKPKFDADVLTTNVFLDNGYLLSCRSVHLETPNVPQSSENICNFIKHPIDAGKEQTLSYIVDINSNIPAGRVTITWKVLSAVNLKHSCCFKTQTTLV